MAYEYDWEKIEAEYVTGNISYRELCDKYGISYNALSLQASKKKWTAKRKDHRAKMVSKSIKKIEEKGIAYKNTLYELASSMANKLKDIINERSIEDFVAMGLKPRDITSAIKDIEDILHIKSERDLEEQIARIEKLRKDAEGDGSNKKEIKITIAGELDEYSK